MSNVMHHKSRARNRPKHQHWVPQFYLRYFATPATRNSKAPKVWIFSKETSDGDEKLTSIRNVCGKRYLYSPRDQTGERNWDLDDEIGDLEAMLSQIWPALATDYVALGDEHVRKALSLFVAVMHFRHPDTRSMLEVIHHQLVACYETCPLGADGTPQIDSVKVDGEIYQVDTSEWLAYKNSGTDKHHRSFVSAIRSEAGRMAEHLLSKRWSVIVSDTDIFITTDKPVVLLHEARERFGYGTPGSIIYFPLSPTRLLILDDRHDEPSNQYYPLMSTNAGAVNFLLWRGASRFLVTGRGLERVISELCALNNSP